MSAHHKTRSCTVLPAPKLLGEEENLKTAEQQRAQYKAYRKKRNSKSATLLKKLMNSSAQIPFKARRKNQPNQRHVTPPSSQRCDSSGSDDDVSSFVASRSNSVMSVAPVLCPPIPSEQRTRNTVSAKGCSPSSLPPVPASHASGESYTSDDQVISEYPSLYLKATNLSHLMTTLPDPEIVPWSGTEMNAEDEEEDEVRALMTPSYPNDVTRFPYDEDLQFNSALSVLDSSRYEITHGTMQDSIDTVNTDLSDLQDDMSGWSMNSRSDTKSSKATRNNSSGSSLILSGEVCFCPKEGILTLEPNQKQHKASCKANATHASMVRSFSRNSPIDDQIKKKKAHLWGHLFKRKENVHHWTESDKEQRIASN